MEFIEIESQIEYDELQHMSQHYDVVLVQTNPLVDFSNDSSQHMALDEISEVALESDLYVDTVSHTQVLIYLSKSVIRP